MASFCFFDWLCFLPSLEQTSHLSPLRCGHVSKVAWSCSLLPPASSSPPRITTSHFFAASAERRLSGGGCNLQSGNFFLRHNFSNFYKPDKFRGVEFQGPLWAPMRLFPNIATFAFVIVVPALYGNIYRFRKKHTTTALGWWVWKKWLVGIICLYKA